MDVSCKDSGNLGELVTCDLLEPEIWWQEGRETFDFLLSVIYSFSSLAFLLLLLLRV